MQLQVTLRLFEGVLFYRNNSSPVILGEENGLEFDAIVGFLHQLPIAILKVVEVVADVDICCALPGVHRARLLLPEQGVYLGHHVGHVVGLLEQVLHFEGRHFLDIWLNRGRNLCQCVASGAAYLLTELSSRTTAFTRDKYSALG